MKRAIRNNGTHGRFPNDIRHLPLTDSNSPHIGLRCDQCHNWKHTPHARPNRPNPHTTPHQ